MEELGTNEVVWVLDKPVSNSGRLKLLLLEVAQEFNYNWEVILDNNPDTYLVNKKEITISSDGWIIAQVNWFNLAGFIIENKIDKAEIFDFNKITNGE